MILRLLWRSRKNRAYRQRMGERLGLLSISQSSSQPQKLIWVHAVSVGETIAAKPLIESLISQYSEHKILVTSTTPTGSSMVKKLFSDQVEHVYFPYDLPEIVFRFLNRVKPEVLIIVETEIWPNLYAACKKRNIPIMLANARLSKRSTKGYKKIKGLIAETLHCIDVIAVRSEADAHHFRELGASQDQIVVTGNIKFDIELDDEQVKKGRERKAQWGESRPVWVAASTHAGEEEQILAIYSHLLGQHPDLLLVLIPRHLERFDEVFKLCRQQEELQTVRHSLQSNYLGNNFNVVLGDTLGEMQTWYASADMVFMGGSLVPTGGHNPLEAVALGVPVLTGEHVFNFEDIFPLLSDEGLCWVCEDSQQIEQQLIALLEKGSHREDYIQSAKITLEKHNGVTARLMDQAERLL